MLRKLSQTTLTNQNCQKASIHMNTQAIYVTLGNIQNHNSNKGAFESDTYHYDTYIIEKHHRHCLHGLRIYDMQLIKELRQQQPSRIDNQEERFNNQEERYIMLCQQIELGDQQFDGNKQSVINQNVVNLVGDSPTQAKLLSMDKIIKISNDKQRIQLQNFRWSPENSDIFSIFPKKQSKFTIRKRCKNQTVYDSSNSYYFDSFLMNQVTLLNEQQLLVHFGLAQDSYFKSNGIAKIDIEYNQMTSKINASKYHRFQNRAVLMNDHLFVNGRYNTQINQSAIIMFDDRVNGHTVLNLLSSNSPALESLQTELNQGRPLHISLSYLDKLQNNLSVINIVNYQAMKYNYPILIDIRSPGSAQPIKLPQCKYLSHLKQFKYLKNKLCFIQRQYQRFTLIKFSLTQFQLSQ